MKGQQQTQILLVKSGKDISLDITPAVSPGRQLIKSYGNEGFCVADQIYNTSILLTRFETLPWSIKDVKDISLENLSPALNQNGILIIGCGAQFVAPPEDLRVKLKTRGVSLEWMDTGAACRTYNVLLIEERDVVAALIAVD